MTYSPVYKKRITIETRKHHGIAFYVGLGEQYMDRHRGTSIVLTMHFWRTAITIELFNHKPKDNSK